MKRVISAALCLLLAGCASLRQPSGSPIDPALLLLVPSSTHSVLWISMEKLVKTQGYAQLVKSETISVPLDLIAAQTTYDPRKTFWQVLIVSNGANSVLLTRGEFAPLGMEPEFKKEGAVRSNYKGQSLIATSGIVLTFMSPSCLAVGSRQSMEWFLDAHADRAGGPPKNLLEWAEKIDRKSQIWWKSFAPAELLPKQVPAAGGFSNILANLPRLLNGTQSVGGSVDLNSGLRLQLSADYTDSTKAKDAAGALNGFVSLGRATAPKSKPQQAALYDALKIEQVENAVRMSVEAPVEVLLQ